MYAVAGALFGLVALVSYPLLPSLESTDGAEQARTARDDGKDEGDVVNAGAQQPLATSNRRSLVLCLIAVSLMWGANNAYLISLPLHLTENMGLGAEWVGWLMRSEERRVGKEGTSR